MPNYCFTELSFSLGFIVIKFIIAQSHTDFQLNVLRSSPKNPRDVVFTTRTKLDLAFNVGSLCGCIVQACAIPTPMSSQIQFRLKCHKGTEIYGKTPGERPKQNPLSLFDCILWHCISVRNGENH